VRRALRENGLSTAMFGLFAVFLVCMSLVGARQYNDDQKDHGRPTVSYAGYLTTGAFVEAVFENWESEFLQMGAFVLLTVYLRQKGSPESKTMDSDADEEEARAAGRNGTPWLATAGGAKQWLYERSLATALFALFLVSFLLHAAGGAREYSAQQAAHGGAAAVGLLGYLRTSQFWYESFQNWQSEFLSVAVLVVLSIYLRQRGSTESKPVTAAHSETGTE
jgi:hypothetical protein